MSFVFVCPPISDLVYTLKLTLALALSTIFCVSLALSMCENRFSNGFFTGRRMNKTSRFWGERKKERGKSAHKYTAQH